MNVCSKMLILPKNFRSQKFFSLRIALDCYLKRRRRILAIIISIFLYLQVKKFRKVLRKSSSELKWSRLDHSREISQKKTITLNGKGTVDKDFINDLKYLLKIVFPRWRTKEIRLIVIHSGFLFIRTLLSLYVASLDGKLVSSLVRGQGKLFLTSLICWMVVAVPATFTNSMVR